MQVIHLAHSENVVFWQHSVYYLEPRLLLAVRDRLHHLDNVPGVLQKAGLLPTLSMPKMEVPHLVISLPVFWRYATALFLSSLTYPFILRTFVVGRLALLRVDENIKERFIYAVLTIKLAIEACVLYHSSRRYPFLVGSS
ncbi:hypothetical protein DFH29DRAFT_244945 [Suillus ampliporus]|nr:hypothetical protein DFH29DRAFT_244945 [Suillus ampliporus]